MDSGVDLTNLPVSPGFWRSTRNSTTVLTCYTPPACVPSATSNASGATSGRRRQLSASGGTYGDNLCRAGHSGAYCEVCVEAWYKAADGLCYDCAAAGGTVGATIALPIGILVGFVLISLVFVLRGWRARKKLVSSEEGKPESGDASADRTVSSAEEAISNGRSRLASFMTKLRILIALVQVLSQIGTVFDIPFPPIYKSLVSWLALLQLDLLQVMPLGCLNINSFYLTLLIRTLVPLAIMLALGIFGLLCGRRSAPNSFRRYLGDLMLNIAFFILFLVYPSTSSAIFQTFQCFNLDGLPPMLRADFQIDCTTSTHNAMVGYSMLMVVVYPLGAIALYAYLLFGRYNKPLAKLRNLEIMRIELIKEAQVRARSCCLVPQRVCCPVFCPVCCPVCCPVVVTRYVVKG